MYPNFLFKEMIVYSFSVKSEHTIIDNDDNSLCFQVLSLLL